VHAHIEGNRKLVHERLDGVAGALGDEPLSAFEIVPHVYGDRLSAQNAQWLLSEVLSYLRHLQALGRAHPIAGETERWAA
jgi:hypothetical protein